MDLGSVPTPVKNSGYTTVSSCVQKVDMCSQPEKDTDMLCIWNSYVNYCIYWNARQGFSFKFCTYICEIILNSHMKHQTGLRQTRSLWLVPSRAKLRPVLPNHHVRSLLFWDIMRCCVVIPYRWFRRTHQSHLQGSRNPKREKNTTKVSRKKIFLYGTCPSSDFL